MIGWAAILGMGLTQATFQQVGAFPLQNRLRNQAASKDTQVLGWPVLTWHLGLRIRLQMIHKHT
jgi:hypothetical protein